MIAPHFFSPLPHAVTLACSPKHGASALSPAEGGLTDRNRPPASPCEGGEQLPPPDAAAA